MPNRFIHEDESGVMLQVEYDEDNLICVHLLDADYHVCGPDLALLFDKMFYLVASPLGEDPIGEPYLNSIFQEIQRGRLLRAPARK